MEVVAHGAGDVVELPLAECSKAFVDVLLPNYLSSLLHHTDVASHCTVPTRLALSHMCYKIKSKKTLKLKQL